MLLFPITSEDDRWAERVYPSYVLNVTQWYIDRTDKGGRPYIEHPDRLASKQTTWARKIIALCHDCLEDIMTSEQQFIDSGMPISILSRIQRLTRNYEALHWEGGDEGRPTQTYQEYIQQVAQDLVCLEIKLDDLEHNMEVHRLPTFGDAEISLLKRYHRAYQYLKGQYHDARLAYYTRLAESPR